MFEVCKVLDSERWIPRVVDDDEQEAVLFVLLLVRQDAFSDYLLCFLIGLFIYFY